MCGEGAERGRGGAGERATVCWCLPSFSELLLSIQIRGRWGGPRKSAAATELYFCLNGYSRADLDVLPSPEQSGSTTALQRRRSLAPAAALRPEAVFRELLRTAAVT